MPLSKQEWRKKLKAIREAIHPERKKVASEKACQGLKRMLGKEGLVLSFSSFGSEIDLWSLNRVLAQEGRLVLPRVFGNQLLLYQVDNLNDLEPHALGMLEPIPAHCREMDLLSVAVALVPGLGFDLQSKHRLGYGGGHYDRLLLGAIPGLQKWGVGFAEQGADNLPDDPQDVVLDHIFLF